MSPIHTRRSGKLYRYYISQTALKQQDGSLDCPVRLVPAAQIERIVLDQVHHLIRTPEVIVQTWRAARKLGCEVREAEVRSALTEFEELWDELFPQSNHASSNCWCSGSTSIQIAWTPA
jgi:site-specific DNA recombinase